MGDDSGEKTEEPTPHKLREARKKGQISKSKDLTSALLVLISFNTLRSTGASIWERMTTISVEAYAYIPLQLNVSMIGYLLKNVLTTFLMCVGPIFAANFLVALIVEALQTGFLVALESIKPKFNKLNPIEGAKKFFTLKHYVEFLKSVIKMIIVIIVIYTALKEEFYLVIIAQQLSLWQLMSVTGGIVMKVVTRVVFAYLLIAIFDYMYQKYEYMKSMKMSKKEIKDEYKKLEGDPTIKQRQKEKARQMSQGRQMGAVPGADVVVTNPIYIAIAIQYEPNRMLAPKVLAKGKRLVADEIRQIAEENYIPIIENPALARQMYDLVEPGSFVPPHFYKVVAEILAFVYNLKKKRKSRY